MSASSSLRRTLLTTGALFRPIPTTNLPRIHTRFPITAIRPFTATMSKSGVHNLQNKAEFDNALNEKGKLMVLDCFATWCGPCKAIAPKVAEFSDSYPDVAFYKIDVDDVPEVAQELGVRAMPTFFLFKDGEKVTDIVGANPVALEAAIKQNK